MNVRMNLHPLRLGLRSRVGPVLPDEHQRPNTSFAVPPPNSGQGRPGESGQEPAQASPTREPAGESDQGTRPGGTYDPAAAGAKMVTLRWRD